MDPEGVVRLNFTMITALVREAPAPLRTVYVPEAAVVPTKAYEGGQGPGLAVRNLTRCRLV